MTELSEQELAAEPLPRLTREQAAIIGAYTGILCGDMADLHEYIERTVGRPVWTHQLADPIVWAEIKAKARADFRAISPVVAESGGGESR